MKLTLQKQIDSDKVLLDFSETNEDLQKCLSLMIKVCEDKWASDLYDKLCKLKKALSETDLLAKEVFGDFHVLTILDE